MILRQKLFLLCLAFTGAGISVHAMQPSVLGETSSDVLSLDGVDQQSEDLSKTDYWTSEEDQRLIVAMRRGLTWRFVAREVKSRTEKQCENRWNILSVLRGYHVLRAKKHAWSLEEDALISSLIRMQNSLILNSAEIVEALRVELDSKRTPFQVEKRWNEFLDPALERSHVTPQEDALIRVLYVKYEGRWSEIADVFSSISRMTIDQSRFLGRRSARALNARFRFLRKMELKKNKKIALVAPQVPQEEIVSSMVRAEMPLIEEFPSFDQNFGQSLVCQFEDEFCAPTFEERAVSPLLLKKSKFYKKRSHWTQEENDLLLSLVQKQQSTESFKKVRFSKIVKNFQEKSVSVRKSVKQIRDHWTEFLDPSLEKSKITSEEDALIPFLHQKYHGSWTRIADVLARAELKTPEGRNLGRRAPTQIKNYFRKELRSQHNDFIDEKRSQWNGKKIKLSLGE